MGLKHNELELKELNLNIKYLFITIAWFID